MSHQDSVVKLIRYHCLYYICYTIVRTCQRAATPGRKVLEITLHGGVNQVQGIKLVHLIIYVEVGVENTYFYTLRECGGCGNVVSAALDPLKNFDSGGKIQLLLNGLFPIRIIYVFFMKYFTNFTNC